MGLLEKFRAGLRRTQEKLSHEIRRIVTGSSRLDGQSLESLEAALLAADLGVETTGRIVESARRAYETQGAGGVHVLEIARAEIESSLGAPAALKEANGALTVFSVVGVNGTGKTTTCAKLAHRLQGQGHTVVLGACDTFRAAAVEQLQAWGGRLSVTVVSGNPGADPAAVAHDAIAASQARHAQYALLDTAGRLHTRNNLMQELQKIHRVAGKKLPGAPHEVLLVLDAPTGLNAMNQAREFHKAVGVTGLIITKLDGTSRAGMVVAIRRELALPVYFVGLGEQPDDLQPFDPGQFARALVGG